jgi:hypothetical protein
MRKKQGNKKNTHRTGGEGAITEIILYGRVQRQ